MTLEEAQRAKLDLVCRKLRCAPARRVVEAGCGWGALALHMARHYGVRVQGVQPLARTARAARATAPGAKGSTTASSSSRTTTATSPGEFDAFVSVGMLEHVGLRHFDALAEVLRRTVKRDGGRGLLHFIGRDVPRPLNAWIRRRIFPGAYPPTLAEVTTRHPRARRHVGPRRREPAAALRADARPLERAVRGRRATACARRTATSSAAPGSSISPAPRRRSRPAGCSSSRSSSRRAIGAAVWTRAASTTAPRCRRMIRCDALVVGGGPAGSTCARALRARRLERRRRSIAPGSRATRSARAG